MKDMSGMELKKKLIAGLGLKASQLSVVHDKYSMGSSYRVTVKAEVALSKVKELAKEYESIDYDSYSGEILSGGNTFVTVDYGKFELAAETKAKILAAVNNLVFASDEDTHDRINRLARHLENEGAFEGFTKIDMAYLIRQIGYDNLKAALGAAY